MKMSKKLITTMAAFSLSAFILQPPQVVSAANSISTTMSSKTTVMPLADKIEWVYYTAEDGKIYKRLYNYSTRDWIGEWIYVRG
ncbi:MAG: hypothetical protein HFH74_16080 [Lachnospiraceae bacterium]|jgi:hypothetical protein|nr:hypothetical protein [Lachnospiraceae bacterium]